MVSLEPLHAPEHPLGYGHQARRKTLRIDKPIAIAIPCSTPSRATPRNAVIDSANSTLRCCQSLAVPGISARESDAVMTTAARTG